jgi:hypothetical protein
MTTRAGGLVVLVERVSDWHIGEDIMIAEQFSQVATGRRVLRLSSSFLTIMMTKGVHHYSVQGDALPEGCRIVEASMQVSSEDGSEELVLIIESETWPTSDALSAEDIRPCFTKHYCQ